MSSRTHRPFLLIAAPKLAVAAGVAASVTREQGGAPPTSGTRLCFNQVPCYRVFNKATAKTRSILIVLMLMKAHSFIGALNSVPAMTCMT